MPSTYSEIWVKLLSEGVTSFTVSDLSARFAKNEGAARVAISRAEDQGWLFSPVRGFYVIVPPEYRSWGVVPGDRFIDAAMRHLGARYYVGYLSAAAIHGATHQAAQQFQVVVDRRLTDRDLSGLQLRYYQTDDIATRDVQNVSGEHGRLVVATPETCLFDLLDRPDRSGGLGNVFTVAKELPLDPSRLASTAARRTSSVASSRRAGWVLARSARALDLAPLRLVAKLGIGAPTKLDPRAGDGDIDREWGIVVNAVAEADDQ